jgi:hypothetical protein
MPPPIGSTCHRQDIVLTQGITFSWPVTVRNADLTPFDLTGYTMAAQVRRRASSAGAPAASFSFTPDANPSSGKFTISMSAAATALIPYVDPSPVSPQYVWDLRLTAPGGVVSLLACGSVTIRQGVTR